MRRLLLVVICLLEICLGDIYGQRFPCDGKLSIATERTFFGQNTPSTQLSYSLQIPFGPLIFTPIVTYSEANFDALGFNSRDNFIYAVQTGTNAIIRLKSDATYDTVGLVTAVDTLHVYAGDCTSDGFYLCHDTKLNQILVFRVLDQFELVERIDLYWDPTSSFSGAFEAKIFDLAINPNNSTVAHSYIGNYEDTGLIPIEARGKLIEINIDLSDPNVGMVTPLATVDKDAINHLGALFYSARGVLYGYGSSPRSFGKAQDQYVSLVPSTGLNQIFHESINPLTVRSDGFTCPYSFSFTNLAPNDGIYCGGDKDKFELTINNDSFDEIKDLTLVDTFPEGMLIDTVTGNFDIYSNSISGIDSRFLQITGLTVPPRTTVTVIVQVRTTDILVGERRNQAILSNLPEKFGGDMPSDDPYTIGLIGDSSYFNIIPWSLENVDWEISQPTDCINANDGQVIIYSDDFVQEKEYQIKLRNKIGWEESIFILTTDSNHSLLIDSLPPGDYELYDFKAVDEKCSLSLRDTTITIDAPNEQLQISASSNSPLCQGAELELRSSISEPESEIYWSSSDISYASIEPNPTRPNITPFESGTYRLNVNFGFCEQTDTIDVRISPEVDATIAGNLQYCVGESLELEAMGDGDELRYEWNGPDGLVRSNSNITRSNLQHEHEGIYHVNIENGGCSDSTSVFVDILTTPTISLPQFLITDYCETPGIYPALEGLSDPTYSWTPSLGLSCTDCASPLLEPLINTNAYLLKVENNNTCADSAKVNVVLDKTGLYKHPNVFKPSSVGENSRFGLYFNCIINSITSFKIFNRWGNEIFSRSNIDAVEVSQLWDGYINGTIAEIGVYIWTAEVQLVDGKTKLIRGNVTLIN